MYGIGAADILNFPVGTVVDTLLMLKVTLRSYLACKHAHYRGRFRAVASAGIVAGASRATLGIHNHRPK